MRKIMYSALVVFGAAGIATAAVMSGSSSEECSMSKKACSARKEMKAAAAVQTTDASVKIVPVANMEVTEKAVTEKVATEKSEKSDCIFRELFGCGE